MKDKVQEIETYVIHHHQKLFIWACNAAMNWTDINQN